MQAVICAAAQGGVNLREIGDRAVGITVDETTRPTRSRPVWRAFGITRADDGDRATIGCPRRCCADSDYLTHPIFHMNRAETEMMRYMRRLADRDLALDRAMIPLGSCTMKLNAAAEMMPITWPEFAQLHPFAPTDQAQGYPR